MKKCQFSDLCVKNRTCYHPDIVLDQGCEIYEKYGASWRHQTVKEPVFQGVKTERLSGRDPNLSNIPKEQLREKRSVLIKRRIENNLPVEQIMEEVSVIYPEVKRSSIKAQVQGTIGDLKRDKN